LTNFSADQESMQRTGPAHEQSVPAAPAAQTALVLTGGGARAAYQAGVLRAIARLRRQSGIRSSTSPFGVIVGTSAGAINCAALACHADDFDGAVAQLGQVWREFHADHVYRTDSIRVIESGAKWLSMLSLGWLIARWHRARPRSLLNNAPLAQLLAETMDMERLDRMLRKDFLQAVAVTASSYSSGRHSVFYQSHRSIESWSRSQRHAIRTQLSIDHLLASAAIPFLFPAVPIPVETVPEYFGDGSMRQAAPLSPAIHLGAQRILVIGSARTNEPANGTLISPDYPNLAQIAGHALSSIFLDTLTADIERVERLNDLLAALPEEKARRSGLRRIQVLSITPSRRVDRIAAEHVQALPVTIRGLLRSVGVSSLAGDLRGAAFASYLLFESSFTRALMEMGESDALARRGEIARFFEWGCDNREARRDDAGSMRAP
jgi:NTE family protein